MEEGLFLRFELWLTIIGKIYVFQEIASNFTSSQKNRISFSIFGTLEQLLLHYNFFFALDPLEMKKWRSWENCGRW